MKVGNICDWTWRFGEVVVTSEVLLVADDTCGWFYAWDEDMNCLYVEEKELKLIYR